jgi:uncharacterized membrane protein (Fun14 family)
MRLGERQPFFLKPAESSRIAMVNQEIALALSAACFGLVIGFFAGYAVRAYISRRRLHRYRE